jgi:phage-related protein
MVQGVAKPRIPVVFYRTATGTEPVREWLKSLPEMERRAIGLDLTRVQFRWPIGMPLCRPMGNGLWEMRTDLPSQRIARVFFHLHDDKLVVVHAMVKKTRKTPTPDLTLARKRMKDVMR